MSFKATIEADIKGFTNNIDKAISSVDKLEKTTLQKLSNIGNSFVSIGKRASILSVALVGVGAKAFSMAADFEDALGATGQIFKDNSDTVQDWANSLDTSYGIAKKEALEYSNLMGSMLINIGKLTEEQASKQSAKLIELAGDLTAMYGGTTQDAVRALTGALKGNNTMLDNYGMAVNEALIKQKALELGLISGTSEMGLQAKQAATLALIWEQTGAAQGQAAREADGASGAMRKFRTEVANLSTELGEVLLPIITPIISKLTDIVGSLRALSPEMQSMVVGVAGVTAVAGPLLVVIGNILKALPLIKAALVALTGPVGLVVAAIAGATALIISNWDSIKEYFTTGGGSELFDSLKNLFLSVKNVVSDVFSEIKNTIITIWNAIGDTVKKIWGNTFDSIITTITVAVDIVGGVFNTLISLLKGDFHGALESVKTLGKNVFDGLKNIVFNSLSSMTAALSKFFSFLKLNSLAETFADWSEKIKPSTKKIVDDISTVNDEIKKTAVVTDDTTKSIDDLAKSQEKVVENLKAMRLVIPQKETYSLFNELFTQSGSELILNPVVEPNIDSATLKSKMYESVKSAMGDLSEGIKVISIDLSDMITSTLTDAFGAVSTAIMEGDNVMGALGASLLGTLGGILVDLGKMAIGIGVGLEAIKKAFQSLNPALAIAAGVALIALGSLFSAGSRKLASSMGGGGAGYSSAPSLRNTGPGYAPSEYRGQYQDDFKVEFKIGTNELVGVLNTAEQRRNRL